MSLYLVEFTELFDDEPVRIKLAQRTVRRFYMEDEFDGCAVTMMVEYRVSECGSAVLKLFDWYSQERHELRENHLRQFCTIEDFNEVDGELVPTWTDNHGDYA